MNGIAENWIAYDIDEAYKFAKSKSFEKDLNERKTRKI